jgi:hypothetical protein
MAPLRRALRANKAPTAKCLNASKAIPFLAPSRTVPALPFMFQAVGIYLQNGIDVLWQNSYLDNRVGPGEHPGELHTSTD